MKSNLLTIISCLILGAFAAFSFWQASGDVFLSISVAALGTVLIFILLWVSEKSWENTMGDLWETGYHMEDQRHPRNLACADELLISQEHPAHQCGIQITTQGDVMLHANPGCYTSPFSLN